MLAGHHCAANVDLTDGSVLRRALEVLGSALLCSVLLCSALLSSCLVSSRSLRLASPLLSSSSLSNMNPSHCYQIILKTKWISSIRRSITLDYVGNPFNFTGCSWKSCIFSGIALNDCTLCLDFIEIHPFRWSFIDFCGKYVEFHWIPVMYTQKLIDTRGKPHLWLDMHTL